MIDFDIYNNGSLKKKKDIVWVEICDRLNIKQPLNKIKPLNLYIKVKKNNGNLLSDYRKHKNLCDEKVIINKDSDSAYSDSLSDDFEPVQVKKTYQQAINNHQKRNITFDISLDPEEWNEISPIEKTYRNGTRNQVLKTIWPYIILPKLYIQEKIPCAFSIDRHKVDDIESYIKIEGFCAECEATLEIKCYDKPVISESVTFNVKIKNFRGIPHKKKRRLAGPYRDIVKAQLKNIKPKQWQRDLAAAITNFGDREPPFMYSLEVLQKAAQQIKNEELGIKPGIKLFDSLSLIKQQQDFRKFIRDIGYDKFYVTFWSPEQVSVHIIKFKNL